MDNIDRIVKAWKTIDNRVARYINEYVGINGDKIVIDIELEEFEPTTVKLNVSSESAFKTSLKKCMDVLTQGLINQEFDVSLDYTYSPFIEGYHGDVQLKIMLIDKEKFNTDMKRMGKFKDLLDI